MIYFCSQKNRRALVLQHPTLNGIDYLEVATEGGNCGKQLVITLLKPGGNLAIGVSQVSITGGASSKAQAKVLSVDGPTDAAPRLITIELDHSGDFSTYTLSLTADPTTPDPPPGIDPQLAKVTFSFKAGCPAIGDCVPDTCCPPDDSPEPDINYLAKDFAGFRQVMLDRMAVLVPDWKETHESDVGIALIEALAYDADHLSYQQDAVGTEAYIGTARSRISLRRHARLVDYKVNEGSNARVWVYMECAKNADAVFIPAGTMVFPHVYGLPTLVAPQSPQAGMLLRGTLGFATMQDASLYKEQNQIIIYTWKDSNCCLAPGATEATLEGKLTTLHPGSVLIFEEVKGPKTGDSDDANPKNRWAVRLTGVRTTDHLGADLVDPLNGEPITQITWDPNDALPFPLCISSSTDGQHGSRPLNAVSVARGNIIPADHGIWRDQALDGTFALTNGLANVHGTGANFTSFLQVGQWLVFASDPTQTFYQISAIADDDHLTLSTTYAGLTTLSTSAAVVEDLGTVPDPPAGAVAENSCSCKELPNLPVPRPRYFPKLDKSPVTFAYPGIVLLNGFVSINNGSNIVLGTDTAFTTDLKAGQWIVFAADLTQTFYQVSAISSDFRLTLAVPYAGVTSPASRVTAASTIPASQFLAPSPSAARALPQLRVQDDQGQTWTVVDDLLSSNDSQRACVLEIERDGAAFLRFGDNEYGMAPEPGMDFHALYRAGNGAIGNIGQDSFGHVITTATGVASVRNPLPAAGGVDGETMDQIRRTAPFAFRTQLRAVTENDYGFQAEQDSVIREARGTLRWTGSWYTAFVSLDTAAESGPDTALVLATKKRLNLLRMMGVDLQVEGAIIVGLRIEMNICVAADYFQADVEAALLQLFTSGNRCSGQPGLLAPQNFTFGETIYTSPLISAAQSIQGVVSATMTVFQRMDNPSINGVAQGFLTMGRLEIARCDNDPNRIDHGIFVLHMDGGK